MKSMRSYHHKNNSSDTNHYNYTVNLRLAPVESGIYCQNGPSFNRLNAFNRYFQHILPEYGGFHLPDVWNGYFHITLGKFRLNLDENINTKEKLLVDYIKNNSSPEHYINFLPCRFRTTELNVYSGEYRHAEAEGIDFVTLKVERLDDRVERLYPFLKIIKDAVENKNVDGHWQPKSYEDYLNDLHVTVRKYKENNSKWSSEFIRNCGILQRVQQNPLEFECIALDITQTRRQARYRGFQYWCLGVTGIPLQCARCRRYFENNSRGYCKKCRLYGNDHQCSGCGRKEDKQISWPGYCRTCKCYERLKPLWSTN